MLVWLWHLSLWTECTACCVVSLVPWRVVTWCTYPVALVYCYCWFCLDLKINPWFWHLHWKAHEREMNNQTQIISHYRWCSSCIFLCAFHMWTNPTFLCVDSPPLYVKVSSSCGKVTQTCVNFKSSGMLDSMPLCLRLHYLKPFISGLRSSILACPRLNPLGNFQNTSARHGLIGLFHCPQRFSIQPVSYSWFT